MLTISDKIEELETDITSFKELSLECDINEDGSADAYDIDIIKKACLSISERINMLETDMQSLQERMEINEYNHLYDWVDTTNTRKCCISFIFDDGHADDALIADVFIKNGFTCGFAILADSNLESKCDRYKSLEKKGFTILAHSVDGNPMNTDTSSVNEIKTKFIESRRGLEKYGFKINGWVTPSSQMNDKYVSLLEPIYSYGYTIYYNSDVETAPEYNTVSDSPWRLKRYYLGTSHTRLQEVCNRAIENNGYLTFYYHSADLGKDLSIERLDAILSWLRTKVDNYELEVLPPDLAMRYYFRKRITD